MNNDTSEPFLSFERDGTTARVTMRDGEIVYEGDLPVSASARIFFDAWARLGADFGLQDRMDAAGSSTHKPALH